MIFNSSSASQLIRRCRTRRRIISKLYIYFYFYFTMQVNSLLCTSDTSVLLETAFLSLNFSVECRTRFKSLRGKLYFSGFKTHVENVRCCFSSTVTSALDCVDVIYLMLLPHSSLHPVREGPLYVIYLSDSSCSH